MAEEEGKQSGGGEETETNSQQQFDAVADIMSKFDKSQGSDEDKQEKKEKTDGDNEGGKPVEIKVDGLPDDLLGGKQEESAGDNLPDIDAIEEPKNAEGKDIEAFKSMRVAAQRYKDEVKDLREKLQAGADVALKKELAETKEKLAKVSLSETDAFKNQYQRPVDDVKREIAAVAKEYGLEEAEALTLAKATRKDRESAVLEKTESHTAAAELNLLSQRLRAAEEAAERALNEHEVTARAIADKEREEIQARITKDLDDSVVKLRDAGDFVLNDSSEDPEWINKIKSAAKPLIEEKGYSPEDAVTLITAKFHQNLSKQYLTQKADLDALKKEWEEKVVRKPKVGGGSQKQTSGKKSGDWNTPKEAAEQVIAGIINR